MAWTTQTNGDGKDAAGHDCTPGFMAAMKENGDLGVDGLASSVSLPNNTGFLALSNGTLYVADPPSAAFKRFAVAGLSQEWMKLYTLYETAKSQPIETDPNAVALVAALKAALA